MYVCANRAIARVLTFSTLLVVACERMWLSDFRFRGRGIPELAWFVSVELMLLRTSHLCMSQIDTK